MDNLRDGLPQRNLKFDTENKKERYGYLDPYVNVTGRPAQPRVNNWEYLTSKTWVHNPMFKDTARRFKPCTVLYCTVLYCTVLYTARRFQLSMATILNHMGTLQGVQVCLDQI